VVKYLCSLIFQVVDELSIRTHSNLVHTAACVQVVSKLTHYLAESIFVVNTFLFKRKDISNEHRYTQIGIYVFVYIREHLKKNVRKKSRDMFIISSLIYKARTFALHCISTCHQFKQKPINCFDFENKFNEIQQFKTIQ